MLEKCKRCAGKVDFCLGRITAGYFWQGLVFLKKAFKQIQELLNFCVFNLFKMVPN